MASSSTHSCLLLLFPLLLLLSMAVDSGSAPTPTPAPAATTAEKYQKWCEVASDSQSCVKVMESIPGIQEVEYNDAAKVAKLCMNFGANKSVEAKGAADTLLAAAKGKPSSCLKACAANIKSMVEVLVDLPPGKSSSEDVKTYRTFKVLRDEFKHEKPPACEKDCWNKTSSSADETAIADKFHDIWNVARVGNKQINIIFPSLARQRGRRKHPLDTTRTMHD